MFIHAFFYKNTLYKNVRDENGPKIKNMMHEVMIFLIFWPFKNIAIMKFFFRISFQMHLKPSRADLADLFYFIFLIAAPFHTFYFLLLITSRPPFNSFESKLRPLCLYITFRWFCIHCGSTPCLQYLCRFVITWRYTSTYARKRKRSSLSLAAPLCASGKGDFFHANYISPEGIKNHISVS